MLKSELTQKDQCILYDDLIILYKGKPDHILFCILAIS